jgi:hypothetical protein
MNGLLQTAAELWRLSEAELTRLGEDSLLDHLRHQASEARGRHGGLHPGNLETFLNDRDCVRHPTRLVLEFGEMGPHQFAQPDRDYRSNHPDARVLYLRPILGRRPDLIALAVSYMIPVINYGDVVNDEHCLEYGSILLERPREEYYRQVCQLADFVGAEFLAADEALSEPHTIASCECGGCGCH